MLDPLTVIFVPGGTAAALVLFAGPLLALRQRLWHRAARRRNASFRCARCAAPLVIDDLFLFHGAHVCGTCARTLRQRFRVAIPAALAVALGFGISSLTALVVSATSGGPELSWWLDGRWIPLLLPSVGLAAATLAFLRVAERANRRRESAPWVELEAGDVRRWDLFRLRDQSIDHSTL